MKIFEQEVYTENPSLDVFSVQFDRSMVDEVKRAIRKFNHKDFPSKFNELIHFRAVPCREVANTP